jgi:hypothetical protein
MSFSRLKYDKEAYDLELKRSTIPGNYRLFGLFAENTNQCLSYDGPIGSKIDVSTVKPLNSLNNVNMIELESDLSWRNHKNSKFNDDNVNITNKYNLIDKSNCSLDLIAEDTRFTHPVNNYRSMSTTEFEMTPYLHVNPQSYIQSINDRHGLDSRNFTKDNYKFVKQEFLDNGESLPPIENLNKTVSLQTVK